MKATEKELKIHKEFLNEKIPNALWNHFMDKN